MEAVMKKRDLSEVEAEIIATKDALKNVRGTETEVYARIVGYYRAVRNWNKGKADEFKHRKMFTLDASEKKDFVLEENNAPEKNEIQPMPHPSLDAFHYEFFYRQTCPNCPPVKAYIANLVADGIKIDVDTKEGLNLAACKGVFAAPTVIIYNAKNEEVARAHNVEELSTVFEPVAAAV